MAAPPLSLLFFFLIVTLLGIGVQGATATWCVARSDASTQALQTALDYACASGADCVPIQADGLCFLPNTIQARASYAFNSYYQRKGMAPGSCDFSGTATIAQTDRSLQNEMAADDEKKPTVQLWLLKAEGPGQTYSVPNG